MIIFKNQQKVVKLISYLIPFSNKRKRFRRTFELYSFKEKAYFQNMKYNLISLGENCLPRILSTASKLKSPKRYGELSCPFDLSLHLDINVVINLIENDFEGFFDSVEYDKNQKCWKNEELKSLYNHEKVNNRDFFVKRYKKRIQNFYYILSQDKPLFLLYNKSESADAEQIKRLYEVISARRKDKKTYLIVLGSDNKVEETDNILYIKVKEEELHQYAEWGYLCQTYKKSKWYFDLVKPIRKIIKEKLKNKVSV